MEIFGRFNEFSRCQYGQLRIGDLYIESKLFDQQECVLNDAGIQVKTAGTGSDIHLGGYGGCAIPPDSDKAPVVRLHLDCRYGALPMRCHYG